MVCGHGHKASRLSFWVHWYADFLRATVSEHPRDNVIWYYTAVNLLNAYAWIGLLPGALKAYLWKDHHLVRPSAREGYLLLWIGTIFIFFQCMATKYITYTYPILMPLSIFTASYFVEKGEALSLKGVLGGNLLFMEPWRQLPTICRNWHRGCFPIQRISFTLSASS